MKILHRYILTTLLRNTGLVIALFVSLFMIIDFFDRIDNLIAAGSSLGSAIQYFVYKIPLTFNLMLPLSYLCATLFTLGIFSKNSELTAMRASGLSTFYLAQPIYILGLSLSLLSLILNETIVPVATRRVKEIYNIDIQKKDEKGTYSQSNYWQRDKERFINMEMFDSRINSMLGLSVFDVDQNFAVTRRFEAKRSEWIKPIYGWTMRDVQERQFSGNNEVFAQKLPAFPLTIQDGPEEFYDVKADADTMSYHDLKKYIRKQSVNGVKTGGLYTDLYQKFSFPFITFISSFVALTFAVKPARSGGLAMSFSAGLIIGFSYYVVHSYSMALGRAEFLYPLIAAWLANLVMFTVGTVLHLGVDSPS